MSAAHSISTAPARGRWLVPSLVFLFLLALLPWASSPFILHLAILTTLNITIVNGLALVSRSGQLSLGHAAFRSEEHTSELQSLMRSSYAVFCLKNKNTLQYKQI